MSGPQRLEWRWATAADPWSWIRAGERTAGLLEGPTARRDYLYNVARAKQSPNDVTSYFITLPDVREDARSDSPSACFHLHCIFNIVYTNRTISELFCFCGRDYYSSVWGPIWVSHLLFFLPLRSLIYILYLWHICGWFFALLECYASGSCMLRHGCV